MTQLAPGIDVAIIGLLRHQDASEIQRIAHDGTNRPSFRRSRHRVLFCFGACVFIFWFPGGNTFRFLAAVPKSSYSFIVPNRAAQVRATLHIFSDIFLADYTAVLSRRAGTPHNFRDFAAFHYGIAAVDTHLARQKRVADGKAVVNTCLGCE